MDAKHRRLSFLSPVYVMPAIAIMIAAWLLYTTIPDDGPRVELVSVDAEGIESGRTAVRFRGVEIGHVADIRLQADREHVLIGIQLDATAGDFAKRGAQYWIVHPELKLGQISGLHTIIAGRYIQAEPGSGDVQPRFTVRDVAPLSGVSTDSLGLTLIAGNAHSLSRGSGVFYRGIQVGVIETVHFGKDTNEVHLDARIFTPYAAIVRKNSVFWTRSGLNLQFSLFKGIALDADSLQSLLSGAIEMATPTDYGEAATKGDKFPLASEAPAGWEGWAPRFGEDRAGTQASRLPPNEPARAREANIPAIIHG